MSGKHGQLSIPWDGALCISITLSLWPKVPTPIHSLPTSAIMPLVFNDYLELSNPSVRNYRGVRSVFYDTTIFSCDRHERLTAIIIHAFSPTEELFTCGTVARVRGFAFPYGDGTEKPHIVINANFGGITAYQGDFTGPIDAAVTVTGTVHKLLDVATECIILEVDKATPQGNWYIG